MGGEKTVIRAGLYATPVIALVVSPSLPYFYTTPKAFLFRGVIEALVLVSLIAMLRGTLWLNRDVVRPPVLSYLLLVVVLSLAAIQGVNPSFSVWGRVGRLDGLVQTFHYAAFLLLMLQVFTKEEDWRWFFRISLGVSVVVALYGIWQVALADQAMMRPKSTIGNPGFLGGYLMMHVFLGLFLAVRSAGMLRLLYAEMAAILAVALWLSGTRGSLLGLVVGLTVIGILMSTCAATVSVWRFGTLGLTLGVAAVTLWGVVGQSRLTGTDAATTLLERMTTIEDPATLYRLRAWKIAWEGIMEKPILGWGANNYHQVFATYFEPLPQLTIPGPDWWDLAHNVLLDVGVAAGMVGMMAFLGLFGVVIWAFFRRGGSGQDTANDYDLGGFLLIGMVTAYLVHLLFLFPVTVTTIPFLGVVGYANYCWRPSDVSRTVRVTHPAAKVVMVMLAAGLIVALYQWTIMPVKHLRDFVLATPRVALLKDPAEIHRIRDVLEVQDFDRRTLHLFLGAYAKEAAKHPDIPLDMRRQLLELAAAGLRTQVAMNPTDLRPLWTLGDVLFELARVEPSALAEATERFRQVVALSPKRPRANVDMAAALAAVGRYGEAETFLQMATELSPRWINPHIQLMALYIVTKQEAKQKEERGRLASLVRDQRPALQYSEPEARQIAAAYLKAGKKEKARHVWTQRWE